MDKSTVLAFHQQSDPLSKALPAWTPNERGDLVGSGHPKVRQIEKIQGKSQDIVSRLKATGLGKFYVSHLKPLPPVRGLVVWIWRNAYPVYVNHIAKLPRNRNAKQWRRLTRLGEFAKKKGIPLTLVADAAQVETPAPRVFPSIDQGYLVSPHDRYSFPHIQVAEIGAGMIYGGTNLVLTKDGVICHDLYDFERDYTSEELHGRTLIDPARTRIRWLLHDDSPERLPAAAAFADACASNYAHWLTEVLPRIAAFCAAEQFKDIPIVVNDGLHKNIMESLFLVTGEGREIITLPIGRALQVDALYLTSVAGYVPFERRNNKLQGHSHGVFSPSAFELIRNQVVSSMENLPEKTWPENIYLRRNSGARKVTNATELEEVLIAQGYVIVEPEKLTFLQQAQLFSHATMIVGSSGAALANIIFAPSGTKIFILIGKYQDTSYWYWQNIACASGKTVSYIFGKVSDHTGGIHADFTVDPDDFKMLTD
jgi:capsular polysaccharide biosynthesis protein